MVTHDDLASMAEELIRDHAPVVLSLAPLDAVVVAGLLQVALTYPGVDAQSDRLARRLIETFLTQLADCPFTTAVVRDTDPPPACTNPARGVRRPRQRDRKQGDAFP